MGSSAPKSKNPMLKSEQTNVAGRNTMVRMVMAFMVLLSEWEARARRIIVRASVAEIVESICRERLSKLVA